MANHHQTQDHLLHRQPTVREIVSEYDPQASERGSPLFTIFGPTGSGKTTVGKYALNKINTTYESVRTAHIDCGVATTETAILQDLVKKFCDPINEVQNHARHEYLQTIHELESPLVCVIDDLQFLEDVTVLRSLIDASNVWVIGISLDKHQLRVQLTPDLLSRIEMARSVELEPYSHTELCDILKEYVREELTYQRPTTRVIHRIAEIADGDARRAFTLLRRTLKEASRNDCIADRKLVDRILGDSLGESAVETSSLSISTHQEVLYQIIKESESIGAGALKRKYRNQVPDPKSDRMRQKYLTELFEADLITKTGTGRGVRYYAN